MSRLISRAVSLDATACRGRVTLSVVCVLSIVCPFSVVRMAHGFRYNSAPVPSAPGAACRAASAGSYSRNHYIGGSEPLAEISLILEDGKNGRKKVRQPPEEPPRVS